MIEAQVFRLLRAKGAQPARDMARQLGIKTRHVSKALARLGPEYVVMSGGPRARTFVWHALDRLPPEDMRGMSANSLAQLIHNVRGVRKPKLTKPRVIRKKLGRPKGVKNKPKVTYAKPVLSELELCWGGVVAVNKSKEQTWI